MVQSVTAKRCGDLLRCLRLRRENGPRAMDQPEKTFHVAIPAPAKTVLFNPRHAVRARAKT